MNPLIALDTFLMWRVFTPAAHWVDYRWHVNHFRLALFSIKAGVVAFIAGSFAGFLLHHSWLNGATLALCGASSLSCLTWVVSLADCSAAYERDPSVIPRKAWGFLLFPPPVRAMLAVMSLSFSAMVFCIGAILLATGMLIQSFYLPGMIAMFYFGGVIPSGRARHPKKERAPASQQMPVPVH